MQINGVEVFISPLAVTTVQVKKHKRNKRINKKWLKRYGMKRVDNVIVTPYGIYVSKDTYYKLKVAGSGTENFKDALKRCAYY